MQSRSQLVRALRGAALQGARILLGAAVVVTSAALAWKLITAPPPRAKPPVLAERAGPGYVVLAGEAVDLELVAPDGKRTSTSSRADTTIRIPESDGSVDCGGYGRAREAESSCSASVIVHNPAFGEYKVVVSSPDSARGETITVGFGGSTFRRNGAFSVRVVVGPQRPVDFAITVAPEGASQRSQPKMPQP
ncbi:MAG: hypothetical protein ACHQQ3_02180 [Gemmatimonadales bacterium]